MVSTRTRAAGVTGVTVVFVLMLVVAGLSGAVAAQEAGDEPVNQTMVDGEDEPEYDSETLIQLETATVQSITFEDGQAEFIIYMEIPGTVVIQDQSAVGMTSGGTIQQRSIQLSGGTHKITMDLIGNNHRVGVIQGTRGEVVDRGMAFGILEGAVTVALIQTGVIAGAIAVFVDLIVAIRRIRKEHETTYKNVLSGERVRIQEKSLDDWRDRVLAGAKRHWFAVSSVVFMAAWAFAAWMGVVPSPGEAWQLIGDVGRVFTIVFGVVFGLMYIPVKYKSYDLWAPAKEIIIELDARDVIDSSLEGFAQLDDADPEDLEEVAEELQEREEIDGVEVWSGDPDNVAQMRVAGKPADVQTSGGTGYLVEDFDPKRNTARGTWPGTANDIQLISDRSKIDANKEILRDESKMLRTLLGAMPAISTVADTQAMRSVDREFRQLVNIDSDPIDDLMSRASQGTRFEDYYDDDDEQDGDEYEELVDSDDENDNEDDEDGDNQ